MCLPENLNHWFVPKNNNNKASPKHAHVLDPDKYGEFSSAQLQKLEVIKKKKYSSSHHDEIPPTLQRQLVGKQVNILLAKSFPLITEILCKHGPIVQKHS